MEHAKDETSKSIDVQFNITEKQPIFTFERVELVDFFLAFLLKNDLQIHRLSTH